MNYLEFLDCLMESNIVTPEEQQQAIKLATPKVLQQLTPEELSWFKRSAFMGLKKEIYDRIVELSKE